MSIESTPVAKRTLPIRGVSPLAAMTGPSPTRAARLTALGAEVRGDVEERKQPRPSGAALHSACYAANGPLALQLTLEGADVHYISKANRQTPLHQACIQGLELAAVEMIRRGARLDVRDYYNRTPLEAARDLGHPELVAPLVHEARLTAALEGTSAALAHVLGKKKMYVAGDAQLNYTRKTPTRLVERHDTDPWDATPRQAVGSGWLRGRMAPHSAGVLQRRLTAGSAAVAEWSADGGHRVCS